MSCSYNGVSESSDKVTVHSTHFFTEYVHNNSFIDMSLGIIIIILAFIIVQCSCLLATALSEDASSLGNPYSLVLVGMQQLLFYCIK